MKGIETRLLPDSAGSSASRSDHCPAMKGIETRFLEIRGIAPNLEATTAPQ